MDEILYFTSLFDLYKDVLTENQRETFSLYFFENLTLEEIATNRGVSKNAISKAIKTAKDDLQRLERQLHMLEYIESIKSEFKDEKDILQRIDKYDNIIL